MLKGNIEATYTNKKERKTKMNIQIKILDFFKKMKTEVL